MSASTLHRFAFKQSRLAEYFSAKELGMQIGGARPDWPFILVKELIDNALDATESHTAPVITLTIETDRFTVTDNGPGLPDEIITGSLDYSARISTKAAYVSPTRGRLGNALKVIYAAPYVADGKRGRVIIDTAAARSVVTATYDPIAQEPRLERMIEAPVVKIGTSITVEWIEEACLLDRANIGRFYGLVATFAAVNPHAAFEIRAGEQRIKAFPARDPGWSKWHVTRPTPAHWYTVAQLRALVAASLNVAPDQTVRQFVAQFAGLSGTAKQKAVTEAARVGSKLADLVTDTEIDMGAVHRLQVAMRDACNPPKPTALGVIGRERLRAWIDTQGDVSDFAYQKRMGVLVDDADDLGEWPYVLEVAFAVLSEGPRRVHVGINWSAPAKSSALYLDPAFSGAMIEPSDPVCLVVSVAIVEATFSDHGKARLELTGALSEDIREMIQVAAKPWTKMKAKMHREQMATYRHWQERQRQLSRPKLSAKAACFTPGVMAAAYAKASGNGQYPANARQIMYAIRPVIIEMTGKAAPWKNSATFTQVILPDYIEAHPEETADWDVVFDDRGHFAEPHTGRRIGLGTVAVRDYIARWNQTAPAGKLDNDEEGEGAIIDGSFETQGPVNRFRFALFIEKEGFQSLLDRAQFAERFDIAIFSTKGMSVTAARALVEALAGQGVVILTLHDFDKAGLKIHHTLTNDTRRYRFKTRPTVIDLGLRLADVEALELDSEPVEYGSDRDPRLDILASGGTQAEADFLVREGHAKDWRGARVELNALTSAQFVAWLDAKLIEAGVSKVIPEPGILMTAFERVRRAALVEQRTRDIVKAVNDERIDSPPDLTALVEQRIQDDPSLSWDEAVRLIATESMKEVA